MPTIPGTIDLGKFRVVYEEEQEHGSGESDGYLLQQRAIIRLNEALVKIEQPDDYAVYCDEKTSRNKPASVPRRCNTSSPPSAFACSAN